MKMATDTISSAMVSKIGTMFKATDPSVAAEAATAQTIALTNQTSASTNQVASATSQSASATMLTAANINQSAAATMLSAANTNLSAAGGGGGGASGLIGAGIGAMAGGGGGGTMASGTFQSTTGQTMSQFGTSYISGGYHAGAGSVGTSKPMRLHGGLEADEFPAILQAGEKVIPKNRAKNSQGGGKMVLNVNITALDSQSVFQAIRPLKNELASLLTDARSLNHPSRRNG